MERGVKLAETAKRHPRNALSAVKVRTLKAPGRYADGNGLYLIIDPSGARRWILRTVVQGRRRDIGLGGTSYVSLAEAREKARAMRALARAGGDPLAERRTAQRVAPTFAEAAEQVFNERKDSWRNSKHQQQWINTLRTYAFPHFGDRPIDQISSPDLLRALSAIWLAKPETARRVKQRLSTVFDWAKAAGFIHVENPVAGVDRGLPKQTAPQKHHNALDIDAVPGFVAQLRELNISPSVKLGFEFLILTATRTSETIGAQWTELDGDKAAWTIPGTRTKTKRDYRIPLAPRAVEILAQARQLDAGGSYVFAGQRLGRPISNMAFLMTLRRMKIDTTAHGFRSTFRDWASERTSFPSDVCEMALGHTIKNKVEAAYRRGDLFEKRRELMEAWARFCLFGVQDGN